MKNRIPFIISAILIAVALAAGIWMLVSGIRGTIEQNELKEKYESVEGNLSDYTLASPGGYDAVRRRHTSPTYRLTYTYFVDNMPYTVTTEYSTGTVPALGTARTVYFDPIDPENAVLGGTSSSSVLLLGGVMFTAIPLVFILGFCYMMDLLPKTRIDIMAVIMGGVMAAIGGGFLMLMEDGVRFHPMMVIPGLMIAAGLLTVFRGIFPGKK